MADQRSDDIQGLFSHLGLDPGAYQELRSATKEERATEASQRWSVSPAAATTGVARPTLAERGLEPQAAGPILPAGGTLADAPGQEPVPLGPVPVVSARQTLESFFESVKRSPAPVAATSPATLPGSDRPTDKLLRELQRLAQESSTRISKLTDDASQRVAEGTHGGHLPATPRPSLTGLDAPSPNDVRSRVNRFNDERAAEAAAVSPPPLVPPRAEVARGEPPRAETARMEAPRVEPGVEPDKTDASAGGLQDIFRRLEKANRDRG